MGKPLPAAPKPQPGYFKNWSPRFWLGCDLFAWTRMMGKGRFAWHLPHLHIGAITFSLSFGHTILRWLQQGMYGEAIARTKIEQPPVFILGHWRTGTTLLHEFLILDPRHHYPNTYQCMEPNHFLLTEELVKKYCGFLMPERRPMDNMAAGWDRPQEDEFALCMMGQASPYLQIAFPNETPIDAAAFDIEALPKWQQRNWKKAFYRYIQTLTFKDARRLILKSPPHSCRIATLLKLFPDARFIHIVRNPYVVYPSTVRLWKSLYDKQGMQTPHYHGIEEKVFETFNYLYGKLEEGKKQIQPSRFYELKYEDLIQNPMQQMRTMYEHLELGDFAPVQPHLETYLSKNANYETNKYQLSKEERLEINQRWGYYIQKYGYDTTSPVPEVSAGLDTIIEDQPTINSPRQVPAEALSAAAS